MDTTYRNEGTKGEKVSLQPLTSSLSRRLFDREELSGESYALTLATKTLHAFSLFGLNFLKNHTYAS